MVDSLRLEGNGRSVDLYSWLSAKAKGHEALAGIVGFGLPGITNQWFEGAGSGATYRGSKVEKRKIDLPLQVFADSRSDLADLLSDLSVILDPLVVPTGSDKRGVARLFFGMPDDDEWYIDVAREGVADWARKVDSDDRTFFKTKLSLESGDPFWTRSTPESFTLQRDSSGPTLMPRMAKLRVSSTAVLGDKTVTNIGDTYAWAKFTAYGPFTSLEMVGPNGEIVLWNGNILAGQALFIDMRNSVVEDDLGVNRYDGLAAAPQFWPIAPGVSEVTVQAENSGAETQIVAEWWPRRWAVV